METDDPIKDAKQKLSARVNKHEKEGRQTSAAAIDNASSITPPQYSQFTTRYDSETGAIWCWMKPEPRPCMNTRLIEELALSQQRLTSLYSSQHSDVIWPFHYLILASRIPGTFNLGGDLALFYQCIIERDEEKLRSYAYSCINLLHRNIDNLDLPITLISLVQGEALGGGFEIALSCDVIIAERGSHLGFPEILFNLFPGMGAYNLLSRRVGPAMAERLILSGKTWTAAKLHEMGVIDILVEDGEGIQAVEKYLKSHNQSHNTIRAIKKVRRIVNPITQKELYDIVDIWVDSAMKLKQKDLAKMQRLLNLQKNLKDSQHTREIRNIKIPRRGEWRKIKDASFPLVTHLGEVVEHDRRKNGNRRRH